MRKLITERVTERAKSLQAAVQKKVANAQSLIADRRTENVHKILQHEIEQLRGRRAEILKLKGQLNALTLEPTDMLSIWSKKLETEGPKWNEFFSNRIEHLIARQNSDNPHNLEKEPAEIQIAKDTLSQISTSYNTALGERKKAIRKVKQRLAEIDKLKLLASDENLSQLKDLANTLLEYNPELKTSMDSFDNLDDTTALLKSFEMDSDHQLSTINDSLKKSLPNISNLENQVKHAKVQRFEKAFELERNAKKITTRISCSIQLAARQVITHYLNGHINTNYQSCLGVLKQRARLTPIESIHNKTTGLLAFAAYEGEGKAYYPERLQQAERKAAAGAERTAAKNRETKENITAKKEELTSSRREIIKYKKNLGLNSEILINDASNSGSATTSLDDQLRSLMLNIDSAAAALARLAKQQEEMQKALDKTHSAINRLNEPEQDQPIEGTLFDKLCDQSKKLIAICETKCQLTFIEPADDSIAGNIVDYSIPAPTTENSFNLKSTLSISEHLIKPETLDLLTERASNSGTYHDIEIPINLLYELSSAITEAERAAAEIEAAAAETQRAEAQRQAAAAEIEAAAAETQRAEAQRQAAAAEIEAAAAKTQRAEAQRQAAEIEAAAETQRAEAQRQAEAAAGITNQQQDGTNSDKTTRSSFSEKWKNLHMGWRVVAAIAIIVGIAAIAFGAHFLMAAVVITKAVICMGGGSMLGGTMLSAATAYGHYRHIKSSNIEPTSTPGDPPPLRDKLKEIAETYQKKRKLFRSDSRTIILKILLEAAGNQNVSDDQALLILTIIQTKIENEKPRFKSYLNTRVSVAIFGKTGNARITPPDPEKINKLTELFADKGIKKFINPTAGSTSTQATRM
jgi:hypothetical protein